LKIEIFFSLSKARTRGRGDSRGGRERRGEGREVGARGRPTLDALVGTPCRVECVGAAALPCLRVNADAGGRPDEKDVRTDIFIEKRLL
jgi:hypothetical protein